MGIIQSHSGVWSKCRGQLAATYSRPRNTSRFTGSVCGPAALWFWTGSPLNRCSYYPPPPHPSRTEGPHHHPPVVTRPSCTSLPPFVFTLSSFPPFYPRLITLTPPPPPHPICCSLQTRAHWYRSRDNVRARSLTRTRLSRPLIIPAHYC